MTLEAQKLALIQIIATVQDDALIEAILKLVRKQLPAATPPASEIVSQKSDAAKPYRQLGFAKGIITYVSPDFDETPPGFEEYMPQNQ